MSLQIKTFYFAVSCDKVEIQHGIVTSHATVPFLPGDHINILCDDGYQLQLRSQVYEISQIFCDKNGNWNADDTVGGLPECKGKVLSFTQMFDFKF